MATRKPDFALAAAAIERKMSSVVFAAAQMIAVEAQISITRGAVSGRQHKPSRPGQPPNADTHFLANNIETTQTGPLEAQVSAEAPYAALLEFGTSKMAARPYMRPARDKVAPEARKLLARAINRAIGLRR